MNPKISVIVPVYKAEKYLHRCVDSILAQTFTDFEVLLIDDGSPDRSGEICDEYAKKDARVRVFHKENGGVSSARNMGIEKAKGEWLMFVDSDDMLTPQALKFCLAHTDGVSMVCCDCQSVHEDGIKEYPRRKVYAPEIIGSLQMVKDILCYNTLCGPVCKLIFREIIGRERFCTSLRKGEDAQFWVSVLIRSKIKIYRCSEIIYKYRILRTSLSHGGKERQIGYIKDLISYLQKLEDDRDIIRLNLLPEIAYCKCYNYLEIIAEQGCIKQFSLEDHEDFIRSFQEYSIKIPPIPVHKLIATNSIKTVSMRLTLRYLPIMMKKWIKGLLYHFNNI